MQIIAICFVINRIKLVKLFDKSNGKKREIASKESELLEWCCSQNTNGKIKSFINRRDELILIELTEKSEWKWCALCATEMDNILHCCAMVHFVDVDERMREREKERHFFENDIRIAPREYIDLYTIHFNINKTVPLSLWATGKPMNRHNKCRRTQTAHIQSIIFPLNFININSMLQFCEDEREKNNKKYTKKFANFHHIPYPFESICTYTYVCLYLWLSCPLSRHCVASTMYQI